MLWAVLALLAAQDDALDALSDDDPGVRARAEESLAALGESARPLLRRGSTHPDPETRATCRRLLAQFDRDLADALQEKLQRPARLGLVTIHAVDRPFEEVLQQLSRATGFPYDPTGVDRTRRVTVRASDANALQLMDEWGLTRDRFIERLAA
ncbi:MAG TPA: HEAT repeat domain-containing protein, partial [Planctomycetota bacterium]|nr:HEAT repeat domain-containing protein [Planctomycetota bacterium]